MRTASSNGYQSPLDEGVELDALAKLLKEERSFYPLHGCATLKLAERARGRHFPNASTESQSRCFRAPSSNNGPKVAGRHASAAPEHTPHVERQ